ncbi:hypothetical protein FOCC_FOCC001703 [Frankliniella occidentalis]|uniref:Uncharacterized protein LOC113203981 n=1 Tax=Frankliniella occidentalis TaxID=133901 RepID=A0A6J1S6B0_FRAOC|nr:uncharacterized protein LOC113203981 [Frankliniella occidentalis]KAE8751456.1 hypothetical protein FOCC_FOCC001703 [Frankliniella occidentalis]
MKTIMRTTLLACMLLAALQFAQASPSPALEAALAETKATSLSATNALTCIAKGVYQFIMDINDTLSFCAQLGEGAGEGMILVVFPICTVGTTILDIARIAFDLSQNC